MTDDFKILTKDQLLEHITSQQDLLVLTENASIAREIKSALLLNNTNNQKHLARISTLDIWLEKRAQQYASNEKKQLATQQQMLQLWEQVIEQEAESFPELQATTLAPQAHRAWIRLLLWHADSAKLAELEAYNQLQLSSWCKKFESKLAVNQLTQRELILKQTETTLATDKVKNQNIPLPYSSLIFIGTGNQITPLHLRILKNSFSSIKQSLWRDTQNLAECFQSSFDNPEREIEAAASWAQSVIQKDENARVGILFTEKNNGAEHLIRKLQSDDQNSSVNICMPQAIADSGIVHSALKLLEINRVELSRAECRALIRSPFWSNYPKDIEQRALWENELCDLEKKHIKTAELINTARSAATKLSVEAGQNLGQKLTQAKNLNKEPNLKQSPQFWAELFSAQLHTLGWPSERTLDKQQQTEFEFFIDLLQQMVSLTLLEPSISYSRAFSLLTRLIQEAKLPAKAPSKGINILNTLESAVGFSHLWLINSSAEHWPGLVKPDLLIPIQYQLEYGMPRCHPDHEREFCINLFDHLRGNCEQLVFSISQKDADQVTEFSPLLPEYPELDLGFLPSTELNIAQQNWQWIDCSNGPALSQSGDQPVRGGSGIFNLMAASPFLAFAQYRLRAKPFSDAFIGIGPHHRGIIIHACLDRIWGQLKRSDELKKMDTSALEVLIDESIHQELLIWQSHNFNLGLAYFDTLKNSFHQLLLEWLTFESGRQDFIVLSREEEIETQIGPLKLRLRMDRIDQLANGSKLLIDYKSGSSSREADLISSPPTAAQLPLYAISLEDELAGLCFAQVVSGAARLRGISSEENTDSLTTIENWPSLIQEWQKDLTALAQSYADGDSRIFETPAVFGRADQLASLHRMAEYQDLMDWHAEH